MPLASTFPKVLTVHEYDSVDISERGSATSLSLSEVETLERVAGTDVPFFTRYHRSVKFNHYGGVVATGERVLEILPKIDAGASNAADRSTLLRMLRLARVLPALTRHGASHDLRHAHLLEAFIETFLDSVVQLSRGGLIKQYITEEDDLTFVRGRIVLTRQLTANWNRTDRIACRYDDLTIDNSWNRIVKLAVVMVRRWISSPSLFSRWVEVDALFVDVSLVTPSDVLSQRLSFNRQAVRYRTAIDWAMAFIRLLAPSLRGGLSFAPALLFNLNRVFEAAIAAQLERLLLPGDELLTKTPRQFGHIIDHPNQRFAELEPDLMLRRGGVVVAIGDTKWKMPDAARGYIQPSQADVYQMYAYAAGFKCRYVTLIYPWQSALTNAKAVTVELPETNGFAPLLHTACVDVASETFRVVLHSGTSAFSDLLAAVEDSAASSYS